jgi:plasmid stabilization system protein ParE
MGIKVIITPQAMADLRAIVEFAAADSSMRAQSLGDELLDRALQVGEFPQAGRKVPEIADPAVREVIHGAYRIVYEISADIGVIYILRFWHAACGKPEIKSQRV